VFINNGLFARACQQIELHNYARADCGGGQKPDWGAKRPTEAISQTQNSDTNKWVSEGRMICEDG